MAVYKATYCYPLLNSLDIRVAVNSSDSCPCEWFTCKVNSSNKKITGYQIRILDSANNQVFPTVVSNGGKGYISPVEELPKDDSDVYINSGLNGTILKIPFFQNYNHSDTPAENQMKLQSHNAVYYVPRYRVDYMARPRFQAILYADSANSFHISGTAAEFDGSALGDLLNVGDLMLLPNDYTGTDHETGTAFTCEKGIFQITDISSQSRHHTVRATRFLNIGSAELEGHEVVITKGEYHDRVYAFDATGEPSIVDDHSGLFVDINGCPINFDITGGTYKWEITLYQGDGLVYGVDDANIIIYENLDFDWFDTVLNSGKILGSTNKRIQIASSLGDDAILPIGTLNSPLVLQGTYAQLFDSNGNPLASRAYVQNYDTTFGHVYPINGGFSREIIDSAEKICFYKHSNNVEDVLAGERVVCATTPSDGDLEIYRQVGGRWEGNPNLGLPTIDGIQLKEGDMVLVKDQNRQCENGVYVAHESGTAWSRSASYKNWGSFIGAILFVINGDINGGTNWESTATAGGSLFDTTTASGESSLIFIPETPISLFVENIKKSVELTREKMPHEVVDPSLGDEVSQDGDTYQVKLYIRKRAKSFDDPGRALSDGVEFAPGQHVLCYNNSHAIIEVVEFGRTLEQNFDSYMTIKYNIIETVDIGDYLNVITGETYGGHVVEITSDSMVDADDQVKRAYILKNGVDHTYISPYVGLKEDMALKLLNNQKVTYSDDSVSQWIRIQADQNSTLKSINTTVWRISHAALAEPLPSDSASDPNIPFAYEVRTYYRTSDENTFFLYEQPYLKIRIITTDDPYEPLPVRYVKLEASYKQFQQASWETYRWTLVDNNDVIIQDTGVKYDRDLAVTFYGLNNESGTNEYKAVLCVTDELKNSITVERSFSIYQGADNPSVEEFTAELDCPSHSVVLSYHPLAADTKYAIYRREYQIYEKLVHTSGGAVRTETKTYAGKWEPVALKTDQSPFRDFNIKSGHSYQYVIYIAEDATATNVFANAKNTGPYSGSAVPIVPQWDEWGLIELTPVKNVVDGPILRKSYEVDLDNIWLFKYSLETGSQTQNIQKSDIQTLGQFQKIGYGRMNYISGDVSCMLGSEIVPYSKIGYVERMRRNIETPLSTNEKVLMLEKWRKIVQSPNPKLLMDMKGQSWIVQIMSGNNTPKNFYSNQPDTISFSWKQIDTTDNVVIIGSGEELPEVGCFDSVWKKVL